MRFFNFVIFLVNILGRTIFNPFLTPFMFWIELRWDSEPERSSHSAHCQPSLRSLKGGIGVELNYSPCSPLPLGKEGSGSSWATLQVPLSLPPYEQEFSGGIRCQNWVSSVPFLPRLIGLWLERQWPRLEPYASDPRFVDSPNSSVEKPV